MEILQTSYSLFYFFSSARGHGSHLNARIEELWLLCKCLDLPTLGTDFSTYFDLSPSLLQPITLTLVYVGTTLKDLSDVTHGWGEFSKTRWVSALSSTLGREGNTSLLWLLSEYQDPDGMFHRPPWSNINLMNYEHSFIKNMLQKYPWVLEELPHYIYILFFLVWCISILYCGCRHS